MDKDFEELNSGLDDIRGGLFNIDTSCAGGDTCTEICTDKCTSIGTRTGTLKGMVNPDPHYPGPSQPLEPKKGL